MTDGWNNSWSTPVAPLQAAPAPKPIDPRDGMNRDQVLLAWQAKQKALAVAKEEEMEYRKYVVSRAFPNATEGTNTLELGNGYQLKAGVKYNYKLADNDTVEKALDEICLVGNIGPVIADRLVSWTPNFLLTEYRVLEEEMKKENPDPTSKKIWDIIQKSKMLTIDNAAPSLEIKEPKAKRK